MGTSLTRRKGGKEGEDRDSVVATRVPNKDDCDDDWLVKQRREEHANNNQTVALDTEYMEWIEGYDPIFAVVLWVIIISLGLLLPIAWTFAIGILGWVWLGAVCTAYIAFALLRCNNERFPVRHQILALSMAVVGIRFVVVGGLQNRLLGNDWSVPAISAACCVANLVLAIVTREPIPWCTLVVIIGQFGSDVVAIKTSNNDARTIPRLVAAAVFTILALSLRTLQDHQHHLLRMDPATPLWLWLVSTSFVLLFYSMIAEEITSHECKADNTFFAEWFIWLAICCVMLLISVSSSTWERTTAAHWCTGTMHMRYDRHGRDCDFLVGMANCAESMRARLSNMSSSSF